MTDFNPNIPYNALPELPPPLELIEAVDETRVDEQRVVGAHRVVLDERCFAQVAHADAGADAVRPHGVGPERKRVFDGAGSAVLAKGLQVRAGATRGVDGLVLLLAGNVARLQLLELLHGSRLLCHRHRLSHIHTFVVNACAGRGNRLLRPFRDKALWHFGRS